ncbi:hypothetical protein CHI06_27670 [Bacillus sp. 7884-1]|nr:hypothetical protein CHI06_27670 [Bacillus sp. 7884-1]
MNIRKFLYYKTNRYLLLWGKSLFPSSSNGQGNRVETMIGESYPFTVLRVQGGYGGSFSSIGCFSINLMQPF